MRRLHAEYIEYTGDLDENGGKTRVVYDPHGFGLAVIRKLAHLRSYREVYFNEPGFVEKVDFKGVTTKITPPGGNDNEWRIRVTAPRQIWEAVARYCAYLEEQEDEGFL